MRPLVLPLLTLLLLSCNKDKDDGNPPPSTGDTGDADTDADADADADTDADVDSDTDSDTATGALNGFLRIVHMAVEAEPAVIFAPPNPAPLLAGLAPGSASTWGPVPPGYQTFSVGPAGGTPKDVWGEVSDDIVAGGRYSLVLYGPSDAPQLALEEEDLTGIPAGEVRLIVWNTGPDMAPFDLLDASGSALVSSITYDAGPVDAFAPAGDLPVFVDLDRDGTGDVELLVPNVGDMVTVPLYFLVQGNNLVMLGHAPLGQHVVRVVPLSTDTGDTAADTGTADTGISDTGTSDTGAGDTSDTAAHTGDTGP